MEQNGNLIIFREFSPLAIIRSFELYINNEIISELSMGESYLISLPPGKYKIYTKFNFSTSRLLEINIIENEVKYFSTGNIGNSKNPFIFIRMFMPKHAIFLKEINLHETFSLDILSSNHNKSSSIRQLNSKTRIFINITTLTVDNTKKIFSCISKIPIGTNLNKYAFLTIKKNIICLGVIGALIGLISNIFNFSHFSLNIIPAIILSAIIFIILKRSFSKYRY